MCILARHSDSIYFWGLVLLKIVLIILSALLLLNQLKQWTEFYKEFLIPYFSANFASFELVVKDKYVDVHISRKFCSDDILVVTPKLFYVNPVIYCAILHVSSFVKSCGRLRHVSSFFIFHYCLGIYAAIL